MVLVPANTSRFGFSPCKKNLLFLVPANMPYFGFGPCGLGLERLQWAKRKIIVI
ncbi:transmembrane protein, putative [Medicago truncatula]|uniref:Transmembrane protein, putative n=1 Tax=Medicago truncatula TaxID=3880 RepID=G7LGM8_MEDTR|nr:transmembrane protein, putative [Medicago truncatula]